MGVGCYVTVDDGCNYVTFHELNVRKKIKTIAKAQLDSASNRELYSAVYTAPRSCFFSFVEDLA